MTYRAALAALFTALTLTACSGPQSPPPDETTAETAEPIANTIDSSAVDIGDVEQGLWLQAHLSGISLGSDVTEEILDDARGKINLVTANVSGGVPASLSLDLSVIPTRTFPDTPVVVRPVCTVKMEYGEGADTSTVEFPLTKRVISNQTPTVPITESVDLIPHLEGTPTSVLVIMKAEVLLSPFGTLEPDVDPETYSVTPELQSEIVGNPLRINFN